MAFSLNRRALLKGAFGAAVGLPLLEAMFEKRVYAQVSAAPKRFVFAYCGIPPVGEEVDDTTGKPPQYFHPDAPGPFAQPMKLGMEAIQTLGLTSDTTVISSMRIPRSGSGNGRRQGTSGFHYETMGPLVSGVSITNGDFSRYSYGPSADWLLAQKLGSLTRFPSLVYLVQPLMHTNGYTLDYISFRPNPNIRNQYDPPTLRNDPISSPKAAYTQLFTGFTPPMQGQAPPPPDPEQLKRKDILSRVRKSYDTLRPKLGAGDRQRLDEHVANVQSLEQRVDALLQPPPAVPAGVCQIPAAPGNDPAETNGYSNEDLRAQNFVDLIHMAFACDLSRICSFEITPSMSGIVLPTSLGITYRNWDGSPLPAGPLHETTHGNGDNLSVAECLRWHMKHVAALAKKLKDTPDVTGNMLDNTVIVFVMEAGLGNTQLSGGTIIGERPPHTSEGMVAVVIGGKSMGMQLGKHIICANGEHPAGVTLSALRAVAGASAFPALGEISAEIPGLRS